MPIADLKLMGRHNLFNALSVFALADALEVAQADIVAGLSAFTGLDHRCQFVRQSQGVDYYNDSKATNVGATYAAVTSLSEAYPKKVIVLLGGQSKQQDFSPLTELMSYAKAFIAYGEDAKLITQHLDSCECVKTLQQAVLHAQQIAREGDCILLSPACASFDQFAGYEARGQAFVSMLGEGK